MGKQPHSKDRSLPGAKYLIATMADTTWRMFVPTVGLILLGLKADLTWQTMPWGTVGGIVVGSVISGLLVRQQLNKGSRQF